MNSNIALATDLTSAVNTGPDYETIVTQDVDDTNVPAWDSGTEYTDGDLVANGGTTYVCIQANANQAPPNATYWATATLTKYAAWFKYTAQANDVVMGCEAYATVGGHTGYRPQINVFTWVGGSPGGSPAELEPSGSGNDLEVGHNQALQFPVTAGTDYYIQVTPDAFSSTLTELTFRMTRGPREVVPAGALFITDDTLGYPAAYLDPTDGHVRRFEASITNGEHGANLPDGTYALINDQTTDPLAVLIYGPANNMIGSVALTDAAGVLSLRSDGVSAFYVSQRLSGDPDTTVRKISTSATLLDTWTVAGEVFDVIAVDAVSEILYFANSGTLSGPIKRYDLNASSPLSDLIAGVASHFVWFDMFVLSDQTILSVFSNAGNTDFFARLLSSAGATIRDFPFTPPTARSDGPRSAIDHDDTLWMWSSGITSGDRVSHFEAYSISSGSQTATFDRFVFQVGEGPAGSSGNDANLQRFGNSKSCPLLVTRALVASTPPLPNPEDLIDESEPCPCPCDCESGGTAGPVIPPINPEWTPDCEGGGTVPSAAEIVESEDWMDGAKEPDTWLTIETEPYPAGSPDDSETFYVGRKPLSDRDRFVESRLTEIGTIERGSSDKDGRYPPARARFAWADDDARLRLLLAGETTRHLFQRMATYNLLSYAGRKANLTPIPLMRGRLVDIQAVPGRRAIVEVQDLIGSHFGPLNPDKVIGVPIGDEHPNLPDETRGQIYSILYGILSDEGALDGNGDSASKGIIPARDCGDTDFESEDPPVMITAPRNLTANYVGSDTGDNTYYYAIVGLTALGQQTPMSNIESVSNLPDSLDVDNYVELNWDPPLIGEDLIVAYWVLGRTAHVPNKRLDTMNNGGTFVNPETTYSDGKQGSRTDFDREKSVNLQPVPTAVNSTTTWTWFAVAIGEVEIIAVYGSDIGDGVPSKRVQLDINAGDVLTPSSDAWPEPNPYRVVGGIRQTGFWARGTRVDHHRQGVVTFAVNVCGYHGLNDLVIDQAYRMLLSFLNNFVELDYRDGDFNQDIAEYPDGTPKFWTSKFELAQETTKDLMGSPDSLGFVGAIGITEPTALATILQRFFTTFGGHLTSDGWGRIYPYIITAGASPSEGILFKERQRINELLDMRVAYDEIVNKGIYHFHRDYDAGTFRNENNTFQDDESIAAHGGDPIGVFQESEKECWYGNDEATMQARWDHELTLYGYPPRYVKWSTNLEPRALVNGDPVRFSHRKDGLGEFGEAESPGMLIKTEILSEPYGLQHTVRLLDIVTAEDDSDIGTGSGELVSAGGGVGSGYVGELPLGS